MTSLESAPGRPTPIASRIAGALRERGKQAGIPLLGFAALLLVWHLSVTIWEVRDYLFPSPAAVGGSLWRGLTAPIDSRASLLYHLGISMRAAGLGFAAGTLFGILLGAWAAMSRTIDSVLSPYVFALQGLPKIAIAPLLMIWFGFGVSTKALLAAILVFFPMFVNTYTGLRNVDRTMVRLFESLGASRWQTLTQLRIPSSMIMIFAGLEIAVIQAILGALVGEFIAANEGMGILLLQYQSVANTSAMFSALIVLALTGILVHRLIRFARHRLVYWAPDSSRVRKEVGLAVR